MLLCTFESCKFEQVKTEKSNKKYKHANTKDQ